MSEVSVKSSVSKVRLRFAKTDDLRFLSHHDLMRLLERLCRRAQLPLRTTEGFNPKPKITFASALSLGIAGQQEVVELELLGELSAEFIINVLKPYVPHGLQFLSGKNVAVKSTMQPVRAIYLLPLSPDVLPHLNAQLESILERESLVIDRIRNVMQAPADLEPMAEERLDAFTNSAPVMIRVEIKKLNIRPFIHRLWRDAFGFWMDVAITNHGAVRPEELLRLVDLENTMLDGKSVLERVKLLLEDELEDSQSCLKQQLEPSEPSSLPITSR